MLAASNKAIKRSYSENTEMSLIHLSLDSFLPYSVVSCLPMGFTLCQGPVPLEWRFPVHLKDRKSTRLNSSHANISYAVFCLKKKTYDTLSSFRISYRK